MARTNVFLTMSAEELAQRVIAAEVAYNAARELGPRNAAQIQYAHADLESARMYLAIANGDEAAIIRQSWIAAKFDAPMSALYGDWYYSEATYAAKYFANGITVPYAVA